MKHIGFEPSQNSLWEKSHLWVNEISLMQQNKLSRTTDKLSVRFGGHGDGNDIFTHVMTPGVPFIASSPVETFSQSMTITWQKKHVFFVLCLWGNTLEHLMIISNVSLRSHWFNLPEQHRINHASADSKYKRPWILSYIFVFILKAKKKNWCNR